ncbi:MAG: hypothetical protein JXR44_03240 [Thiotrichales bacterium]|nr:hypothetical protein [Thiotrichales bacterium]
MKKGLLALLLVAAWYHFYYIETAPSYGAGILAESGPYQYPVNDSTRITLGDFILTPRAEFDGQVRVLDASRSYLSRKGWLASWQLVIGWGDLSDESVYQTVSFSLRDHHYTWKIKESDLLAPQAVLTQTASVHLIAANETVKQQLKTLKIGDLVTLKGTLVDVRRTTGWKWPTSLSRDDTGENSGEILYLRALSIQPPGIGF